MKYTVGQIKKMLQELDQELPEIDENAREADRQLTIRLISQQVSDWLDRGYSFGQIATKLREKGFIRISEKSLRQAVSKPRRRKKAAQKNPSTDVAATGSKPVTSKNPTQRAKKLDSSKKELSQTDSMPNRSSEFLPRADSEDI